jgi:TonB family protein
MRFRLLAPFLLLTCLTCASAAQDSTESRHSVSPAEAGASLITKVNPVYPPLARQARIQGTVILKLIISKTGDIKTLQLVSGHPMLAPAAIEAVKQWKYKPFEVDGEPVEVETTAQVIFQLATKPAPGDSDSNTGQSTPPPADSSANVPQRIRVSSGVAQGLLVSKIDPNYPEDAKQQGIQGVVLLQVEIDKEGNVDKIELISGHPLLAPAAIEAVRQWKYRPYLLNGNPLSVDTQVKVNFTLEER